MNITNIDAAILLLQQRKKLMQARLAASDAPEAGQTTSVTIDGVSIDLCRASLNPALREAVKSALIDNADQLLKVGCNITQE